MCPDISMASVGAGGGGVPFSDTKVHENIF